MKEKIMLNEQINKQNDEPVNKLLDEPINQPLDELFKDRTRFRLWLNKLKKEHIVRDSDGPDSEKDEVTGNQGLLDLKRNIMDIPCEALKDVLDILCADVCKVFPDDCPGAMGCRSSRQGHLIKDLAMDIFELRVENNSLVPIEMIEDSNFSRFIISCSGRYNNESFETWQIRGIYMAMLEAVSKDNVDVLRYMMEKVEGFTPDPHFKGNKILVYMMLSSQFAEIPKVMDYLLNEKDFYSMEDIGLIKDQPPLFPDEDRNRLIEKIRERDEKRKLVSLLDGGVRQKSKAPNI